MFVVTIMALKIPVFVSRINNLSDARYCAGMGVHWLGFSNEDIEKIYTSEELKGMIDWVEGVEKVLEIRNFDTSIPGFFDDFDAILLTKSSQIQSSEKVVFLEIQMNDLQKMGSSFQIRENDYLVITGDNELSHSEKETLFDWNDRFKVILGKGIQRSHLNWIVEELKPAGIMLRGGNEIRPGLKDFDDLADILEYLEIEE